MDQHYDYIIAGAGASGLSLAWKMLQSPLAEKKVLIVDADLEPKNNKTWCFWDSEPPPFGEIIYKKWEKAEVSSFNERFTQRLNDYPYYCLRSIDFKKEIFQAIRNHPKFKLLEAPISEFTNASEKAVLYTGNHFFESDYIFQSCFDPAEVRENTPQYPLLQHFLGWEIEVKKTLFDASTFTLMDFDETFNRGVGFIYLLPWSENSALIEYTIFSDQLAGRDLYEEKISLYLNNRFRLKPIDYRITRREFGRIPMQDRSYVPWYKPRILNLGLAGSITKPSTGYTFKRIQKQTDLIIKGLLNEGRPYFNEPSEWRYKAYDLWLLHIIYHYPKDALRVFNHLFKNNTIDEIFRFLAEETTLKQDLKIMRSVPYLPFLRAIWKTKGRLRKF
ncbi:MAG: lycopene cyclase family protein [Balneolaceae bacterium]